MTKSPKRTCTFCWIVRYLVLVAAVLGGAVAYQAMNSNKDSATDTASESSEKAKLTELNAQLQGATALPVDFRRIPDNANLKLADGTERPAIEFFQDNWSLVFFGFTYCPDICPTALASMAQTMDILREQYPEAADTRVLFVSVDPQRDTPERLKEYTEYFHPEFVGVTGTKSNVDRLTRAMGALYAKTGDTSGDKYLIDHSTQVILIDPSGRMRAMMSPPLVPTEMASNLAMLRNNL